MRLADKKLPFTRLVADYLPEGDYDNQEAGWRIHDFPDDAPHCAYPLVGGLAEDEAKFIVDAVNASLRPQALPEDVRGLVDQLGELPQSYNLRGFEYGAVTQAATLITAQQATIQEMAGEMERLQAEVAKLEIIIRHESALTNERDTWLAEARADLDEAVRVIETCRQTVGEVSLAQSRGSTWYTQGASGLYQMVLMHCDRAINAITPFLAKHQPKDTANNRRGVSTVVGGGD